MHKGDIGWLKAIINYVKCTKALEIIQNYSISLIADKTVYGHDVSGKIYNGFVAKFKHQCLETSTINDCDNAKSTVSRIFSLNETDGTLGSTGVGSLAFYWRVKTNIKITFPKFIDVSLMRICKDAEITNIGTITNGKVRLVDINEQRIDDVTGNS